MIKKLPITILIALFPFLIMAAILLAVYLGTFRKFGLLAVFIALFLALIITVASVAGLIHMIVTWKAREALLANLIIKILYIPVHAFLYLLALAMGNPFLFLLIPVPVIISVMFLGFTGTVALPGIIKGYRDGAYQLPAAVIFCLFSYWYLADIAIAVIAYVKSRKR